MLLCLLAILPARLAHADALAELLEERPAVFAPADEPKLGTWRATTLAQSLTPLAASTRGFYRGLGLSGILGGAQLIYQGVAFIRAFDLSIERLDACEQDDCGTAEIYGAIGGMYSIFIGISLAVPGVAAIAGGAYMMVDNVAPVSADAALQRRYDAGYLKGLGLGLLLTGALNMTAGAIFVGFDATDVYARGAPGRAIGVVSVALGGAQVVAGGVMALVGRSRLSESLARVSLAPLAGPGLGGAVLAGRF